MAYTGNAGRIYGKHERPSDVVSQNAGPNRFNRYHYLRIGRVVEIDPDRYRYKIEWVSGAGSPEWITCSFPYAGPAGCIGTLPEIGALGLYSYQNEGHGKGTPHCLCFLPVSLQAGLDYNILKEIPDSVPTEEDNLKTVKFRKLQRGDVNIASSRGGALFVNDDIELKGSNQDMFMIRHSDQSVIQRSMNYFRFTGGVSAFSGPIVRNNVPIFDTKGNRIPNQLARELNLPDSRTVVYLTPQGAPIDENALHYIEYRVDVDDVGNGQPELHDVVNQNVASTRNPTVSLIMGNYAGASDTNNSTYGKLLRPVIFSKSDDFEGKFNFHECITKNGVDQASLLGVAYGVHLVKKQAFMGFDKEGHYYLHLNSSSSANPGGAGRSMSILGQGNLKEVWGQNADNGNSWDLKTKGGVRWNIGANTGRGKTRSMDVKFSSGIRVDIGGKDDEGYSRQEFLTGNQTVKITGADTKTVSGNSTLTVDGIRTETIRGSGVYDYHSDKSENILGVYTQVVIKEMQGRFGKRKETVMNGQTLEILTGDDVETISFFGSKKTNITLGSIEETINVGSKKVTIQVGNYEVNVNAGLISISNTVGTTKVSGNAGVDITSLVSVKLNALSVKLGGLPIGGVVTSPGHFDYVVGIPLVGSFTVKAGP